MVDPVLIDQETVDQVHDGQDHKALPEPRPEASRAVNQAHADEHIGHIARKAQAPEKRAPLPDGLLCCHAEFNDALS